MLREQGFTENEFEKSGNPVPTMESECSTLCLAVYFANSAKFAAWTFAKQKWQRTKNVAWGDKKFENAQILPGWNERAYA